MTPAARLSAAMTILDRWLSGVPAEKALINWARGSRFAGSGDRAAVRDLVFDAIRCRRSFAALGGAETGRGLILGGVRSAGTDPAPLFTGEGHAPAPVVEEGRPPEGLEALDCPDWIAPALRSSLGPDFAPVMEALRHRAPVFLRAVGDRNAAIAALAADNIMARPHPLANTALEVVEGARRIQNSAAYGTGRVELQDAASQAVIEMLPLKDGDRVLDFCAGGGGKTLAMAARARLDLSAHDIDPKRMADLPARATRAGVSVARVDTKTALSRDYDLVLVDAPCSGSGSWRRAPEGKWLLTPERLDALKRTQGEILDQVAPALRPEGLLAYATCSLLEEENRAQVEAFLSRHAGWQQIAERRLTPLEGGDGFYLALLQAPAA
ncbi:RsmB/NOP family class I SAM-dependent RNA methyltransferase [Falsirhodobacter sp. 20TX0035]|uniref:RsmB/NOP family class I SAM-dependent RNA methyltransferase n=1 Tax=Falsirhodobacter sp. 20TX0035 TaxID=3022019 RepID=UPI00232FD1F2|nr:RsmB/NOP family class I SAM-dependent RNA methyltransferase [Falsirhodobacter sp. 20TX0035]MDB6453527.1 RsmB/NOP family class I SAM-dependent RNA methyltransferase [Falsirhodobacter sp. 20TX0035]